MQWIFFKSMQLRAETNELLIVNEAAQSFLVDLSTAAVRCVTPVPPPLEWAVSGWDPTLGLEYAVSEHESEAEARRAAASLRAEFERGLSAQELRDPRMHHIYISGPGVERLRYDRYGFIGPPPDSGVDP